MESEGQESDRTFVVEKEELLDLVNKIATPESIDEVNYLSNYINHHLLKRVFRNLQQSASAFQI